MARSITSWDRRRVVRVGILILAVIVAAVVIVHQWSPSSATGDQEGGPSGSDVTPTAGQAAGGGGASGAIQTGALASPTEAVPTTPRVVPIGKEDGTTQPSAVPSGDQDPAGGTSP